MNKAVKTLFKEYARVVKKSERATLAYYNGNKDNISLSDYLSYINELDNDLDDLQQSIITLIKTEVQS